MIYRSVTLYNFGGTNTQSSKLAARISKRADQQNQFVTSGAQRDCPNSESTSINMGRCIYRLRKEEFAHAAQGLNVVQVGRLDDMRKALSTSKIYCFILRLNIPLYSIVTVSYCVM